METTLGERIVTHRKKAGLTQDKLADLLGVTAQAVSKWENDQSCPDITMLPKLAEVFHTTTDELLGVATKVAEQEDECTDEHASDKKVSAEWKWEPGQPSAFAFAASVLLVGVLTFVSRLLNWDVSFWDILWPGAILFLGLQGIFDRFSLFNGGCLIIGTYCLLNNLHFLPFQIGEKLIFPIIILLFGFMLLAEAFKKPSAKHFSFQSDAKVKTNFQINGDQFTCQQSFGEGERLVTMPKLSYGDITCSFGQHRIDLSGCEVFSDNCHIDVKCSFSELTLCIPKNIKAEIDSSTAFGDVKSYGVPDPASALVVHISAKVSFGELTVQYV